MKEIIKNGINKIITWQAKKVLLKYQPKVVAVTGSVGKTTTKDAIYTAISSKYFARKSLKSFNSEWGIPLTILGLESGYNNPFKWLSNIYHGFEIILFKDNYPEFLILEVGVDHKDDIEKLKSWLSIDVAVFTTMQEVPVHIEFFKNREEIVREKWKLKDLLKEDGSIIIDKESRDFYDLSKSFEGNKIYFSSVDDNASIFIGSKDIIYQDSKPIGVKANLKIKQENIEKIENNFEIYILGILGFANVKAFVSAILAGAVFGINIEDSIKSFRKHEKSKSRMNILEGINGATIVDDSYNSSPIALESAIETFENLKINGRKIAVVGDMLELGEHSINEHKRLGEKLRNTFYKVITFGVRAKDFGGENFETHEEIIKYLRENLQEGDCVLVKGSQGMRLEKVVEKVVSKNVNIKEEICRQGEEWRC